MGISGVGSFHVQSGGSLIFFQLFRCQNLALNRVFSYFLVTGMFLYLGLSGHPPHSYAPYICMPSVHSYTPRGVHPHMSPYSSVPLCVFWRLCMLWGVGMGSPLCWDTLPYITPVWGCLPLITPPTLSHWFPVH